MADVDDGYAGYYAQRLWSLLPAVYRTDDSDAYGSAGPLQELLNRVGAQVAVVRRSLDRLWADQSIETCDDWVIPYIGELLGTNLVNGLDARGHRLDVAKTIHYRRRKGTLAVLEELARDVTGWDAHVVEGFRRLGRTRHGLDPMVGGAAFPDAGAPDVAGLLTREGLIGPLTGTPAGGLADLRSAHGAALTGSPFDEFFHTADLRAGQGAVGHFGIPKLLVFLWRLTSFAIGAGTPVAVAGCPGEFVFDPTGREVPLFLPVVPPPDDVADAWTPAYEWQVPGPITASLEQALAATGSTAPPAAPYPNPPPNPEPPPATLVPYGYGVTGVALARVWPELGRFRLQPGSPPGPVSGSPPGPAEALSVSYSYGFAANLGAGPYDRLLLGNPPPPAGPQVTAVSGGSGLATALSSVAPAGTVVIGDSLTYRVLADVGTAATPIGAVLVAAAPEQRPVLRPAPGSPPGGSVPAWVFTGAGEAELTLDGLLISGCDVVLRGSFDTVRITACTVDPGTLHRGAPAAPPAATPLASAVDGQPLRPATIWIEADPGAAPGGGSPPGPGSSPPGSGSGAIRQLLVDHSILGPIRTRYGGSVETLTITDSIVQAIPATTGPEYTAADVYDPALLAASLTAKAPLPEALLAALPAPAQAALHTYAAPALVPQAVVDGLNQLVTGPSLWDPARFAAVPLSPDLLALAGQTSSPPSASTATLNRGLLDAALPGALGLAAVAVSNATVTLSRVSVLGALAVHRLVASDTIVTGFANVDDTQDGCVRFSAYVGGSRVPRPYESVTVGLQAALFTSTDYGNPGYGQLLEAVDQAITGGAAGATVSAGADTGSEMGAFSSGLAPIKEQGLLIKYAEYMPLGLTPVIVHVT
ncbi:MAG TPA: hypothetical protein VHA57_10375 [Actinomycetota bacterium]|nr:hypothetical protein [Actinomycetota bacterium]